MPDVLDKQLGVELESNKLMPVVLIDHVQKPSDN
jgi:hypothetical protein